MSFLRQSLQSHRGRTRGRVLAWFRGSALLILASNLHAAPVAVEAMRVWSGPDHTRVVFDLSGPLEYRIFPLSNPDRLVLDVEGAVLAEKFRLVPSDGALRAVRTGSRNGSGLRVVFDLAEGVRPKSFLLPPAEQLGYRLVIDLAPKQAAPAPILVPPKAIGPGRDLVVAIDAGHGGEDPGALGATGSREKNVTLAIARELAQVVNREPGLSAVMIRDGDYFIPLEQRYRKARKAKADIFVSIHADAFNKSSANGSSVFVLSTRGASSQAARWLANRANAADLVGGVSLAQHDNTLAAVLLDLSQSATMRMSNEIASHVLDGLRGLGRVHKASVQFANFVVLRSPDVPSLLVETAFITNPDEERRLNDPAHRRRLAGAIVGGIRGYFQSAPPPGTWYALNTTRQRATEHIVASGETLSTIAARHGVSLAALRRINQRSNEVIRVGERLKIPAATDGGRASG